MLSLTLSNSVDATGSGTEVAVIDSGIMEDHTSLLKNIADQACFINDNSNLGYIGTDITNVPSGIHRDYIRAHTCKTHKIEDKLASDAAEVPRELPHRFNSFGISEYQYFRDPHGSNVGKVVLDNAKKTKLIAVNTFTFNSRRLLVDGSECGTHNWEELNCYGPAGAYKDIFSWLKNKSKLAAVNLSISTNNRCNFEAKNLLALWTKGIPNIAAAGNRGKKSPNPKTRDNRIRWPACSPWVYSVGALDASGKIADYSSTGTRPEETVDFYADGRSTDYKTGSPIQGTSIAAPRVAAAFALMKSAHPSASVIDMYIALTKSADRYVEHPRHDGVKIQVPVVDQASMERAAKCIKNTKQCSNGLNTSIPGELNYTDPLAYGPGYGQDATAYEFTLNLNDVGSSLSLGSAQSVSMSGDMPSQATTPSFSTERDVQLEFTAYTSRVFQNRTPIEIVLNGEVIHTTDLPIQLVSEYPVRYVINRNLFAAGDNVIQLRPERASATWGVKEIRAEFNEIVPLALNRLDSSSYGYEDSQDRYTGLRREFSLSHSQAGDDWNFFVTGNGINATDETAVFLNEQFLGFLTEGATNRDSVPDQFLLPRNRLREGKNLIEFVQRRPGSCAGAAPGQSCSVWRSESDQKWAVKSMMLSLATPNVFPNSFTLDSQANTYTALTSIQNTGDATSIPINVGLYRSTDKTITTADTLLATQVVNGLSNNSALAVNFSFAGNLVKRSDYVGVCVSAVSAADSRLIPTRCSISVKASNGVILVPMMQLLLLE